MIKAALKAVFFLMTSPPSTSINDLKYPIFAIHGTAQSQDPPGR